MEISILNNSNGKKIESEDQLRELIGKVLTITGIKQAPDDIIISACWKMFDHFQTFTPANFMEAFELNEAMVYETRIDHFNSFLPNYMCSVLNCYRSLKNEAIATFKRLQRSKVVFVLQSTPKENYDVFLNYIKENGKPPKFWDWAKIYSFMDDEKIIIKTPAEKKAIMEIIKAQINAAKKNAVDLAEKKAIELELNTDNIILLCKKKIVLDYFNS
jgi:hypothetical protein